MKRPFFLFLPFLLFVAGAFVACEEVEEAGKYDNWVPRNEAFIDSIKAETGNSIVASLEDAKNMEIGKLYAIKVETGGVSVDGNSKPQYVYCKKLWKEDGGAYPLFTDEVSTYYYGTFITGEEFDGNFDGFGATDSKLPLPLSSPSSESSELLAESKWPTDLILLLNFCFESNFRMDMAFAVYAGRRTLATVYPLAKRIWFEW